jgi:hypothetical protein
MNRIWSIKSDGMAIFRALEKAESTEREEQNISPFRGLKSKTGSERGRMSRQKEKNKTSVLF